MIFFWLSTPAFFCGPLYLALSLCSPSFTPTYGILSPRDEDLLLLRPPRSQGSGWFALALISVVTCCIVSCFFGFITMQTVFWPVLVSCERNHHCI